MATLTLPAVDHWLTWEPRARRDVPAAERPESRPRRGLFAALQSAAEWLGRFLLGFVCSVLQFLSYATMVVLLPFMPFLTPVLLAPVLLALLAPVVAFGYVLKGLGWL